MVLAMKVVRSVADEGEKDPRFDMMKPYRGCNIATTTNSPDSRVEYKEVRKMPIESPFRRDCSDP